LSIRSILQDLSTPESGEGGSEHGPLGASVFDKTSQDSENMEEFVAGLHFERKGKLDMMTINNITSQRIHN
jgi:hypothetical protein